MIEIEKEITGAYLGSFPTEHDLNVRVLEDEGDSLIIRVYTKVPGLHPSPYRNLRFDKKSQELSDLAPEDRERFKIENYK